MSIVYGIAVRILQAHGYVELGRLIHSLWKGSGDSSYRFAVDGHEYAFVGMTDAEAIELYELVLNLLEQDFGPLMCEPIRGMKSSSVVPHGYAGVPWRPRPDREPMTSQQVDLLWKRRKRALAMNHPDAVYQREGNVPRTVWSCAFPDKAANDD